VAGPEMAGMMELFSNPDNQAVLKAKMEELKDVSGWLAGWRSSSCSSCSMNWPIVCVCVCVCARMGARVGLSGRSAAAASHLLPPPPSHYLGFLPLLPARSCPGLAGCVLAVCRTPS
jgi:hypothetical protein